MLRITAFAVTLLSLSVAAFADGHMNYRDADEVANALAVLASSSTRARLFTIGYSADYRTSSSRPARYPIKAIRISARTTSFEDDYDKNAILFECGMHAREWLATESCLSLAEYMVAHATDDRTDVPQVLAQADIWIVPLTDVAGRKADDTHSGDPTHFSTSPAAAGWRGNGDTRDCRYGTNIARNFSAGWTGAPSDCAGDDASNYRGFAPFSTEEAVALRNFVQNHSISMAVIVHSNAQKVWNLWGDADVAGAAISKLARMVWSVDMDEASLNLTRTAVGSGQGQFSAWLSSRSDRAGDPDDGTRRSIQTVFIELPIADYTDRWASPNDTGNGFHPSSDDVVDVIERKFIPMAKLLTAASAIPGCLPQYGCPDRDFGLVGAKISTAPNGAGKLETYAATNTSGGAVVPARDYLASGMYYVTWRVQNFSAAATNGDAQVELTIDDGRSQVLQRQALSNLATNEARSGDFRVTFNPDKDYTVTLRINPAGGDSDSFASNDRKVFKFRSYLFQ